MSYLDNIEKVKKQQQAFIIAWAIGCFFYFLEYVVRSSPAVMITQLSTILTVTNLRVSSILGTYYYTYSLTSLIAGIVLDRFGGKNPITVGAAILCAGCLLFSSNIVVSAESGRLLQGAGSAFAFTGCAYLAAHGFDSKRMATAIGITQCVGMLGGAAGQFVAGPLIHKGLPISMFWIIIGIACAVVSILIFLVTPKEDKVSERSAPLLNMLAPYSIVFTNSQSYLSGLISGLLFAPTTIFAMTWGVSFLQNDRQVSYNFAVITCSMVPMGWVIGCPLLGWISDKIGHRKPVLSGGIMMMIVSFALFIFLPGVIPPFISMFIFGVASGAAMIPYTIIKEANPDNVKGSATGGINFLTFIITAIIGPLFAANFGKTLLTSPDHAGHFREAGLFFLSIIAMALVASFIIRETGHGKKAKLS